MSYGSNHPRRFGRLRADVLSDRRSFVRDAGHVDPAVRASGQECADDGEYMTVFGSHVRIPRSFRKPCPYIERRPRLIVIVDELVELEAKGIL